MRIKTRRAYKNGLAGEQSQLRKTSLILAASLLLLGSLACSPPEKASKSEVKEAAKEAAAKLPPDAMPLSSVLKAVEGAGYAPVVEVEFEKQHWDIKAYRDGQLLQLKVGLRAGDILSNPAPKLERPLSAIVKALEDQGYGPILDIEPEDAGSGVPAWNIEAYKGNSEVAVSVESATGKVVTK
jgi:hypothetical protein